MNATSSLFMSRVHLFLLQIHAFSACKFHLSSLVLKTMYKLRTYKDILSRLSFIFFLRQPLVSCKHLFNLLQSCHPSLKTTSYCQDFTQHFHSGCKEFIYILNHLFTLLENEFNFLVASFNYSTYCSISENTCALDRDYRCQLPNGEIA